MVLKAEKEMMPTFRLQNNRKTPDLSSSHQNEGFSLIDAAVSLFILSVALLSVLGLLRSGESLSFKINKKLHSAIEYENKIAEELFEKAR